MPQKVKNVILIVGDYSELPDKLLKIKSYFFPKSNFINYWVGFSFYKHKNINALLDKIDSEISCASLDDSNKVVYISDFIDTPEFLGFIYNAIQNIPSTNYLVLYDSVDACKKGKAETPDKVTWHTFLEYCKANANIINMGNDLSSLDRANQVKFIQDEFKKRDKLISTENSSLFLDFIGANRALLKSEMDKISFIEAKRIEKDDILTNIFPITQEYPVYLFYSAINSGSFSKAIEGANCLLENNFTYDSILILALKQLRWHIVFCGFLVNGEKVDFKRFEKTLNEKKTKEKIAKIKGMDPRIYIQIENNDCDFKAEKPPSYYSLKDIDNFIKNAMSGISNKDKMIKTMERYLDVYNALFDMRTTNKDSHEKIFVDAIRKISIFK